mmetsp:Transcript_22058/g.33685  ORF Transcript_22058/g.33685 Transcript_22058/m.33685 type:complete len:128 (-) Transcript_22058:137-520(-)
MIPVYERRDGKHLSGRRSWDGHDFLWDTLHWGGANVRQNYNINGRPHVYNSFLSGGVPVAHTTTRLYAGHRQRDINNDNKDCKRRHEFWIGALSMESLVPTQSNTCLKRDITRAATDKLHLGCYTNN